MSASKAAAALAAAALAALAVYVALQGPSPPASWPAGPRTPAEEDLTPAPFWIFLYPDIYRRLYDSTPAVACRSYVQRRYGVNVTVPPEPGRPSETLLGRYVSGVFMIMAAEVDIPYPNGTHVKVRCDHSGDIQVTTAAASPTRTP